MRVQLDRVPFPPVAPAALYKASKSNEPDFQLHRLESEAGLICGFETFGSTLPLPNIGETYFFRSWWTPNAMAAALDTDAVWKRKDYPDNGSHEHCIFTWETMSAYSGISTGWWSEAHGWVTNAAYEDHIKGDKYRLRDRRDA